MLACRLPINTKTKLDLTKLFYSWKFHNFRSVCYKDRYFLFMYK